MSDVRRSDLAYVWEKIDPLLHAGMEDLLALDWEEMERPVREPPLAVNWALARQLERSGVLRTLSARSRGKLVGYNIFFVDPAFHYRTTLWAINDAIWLAPEHRVWRNGVKLIREAHAGLAAAGVKKIIYHTRPSVSLGSPKSHATLSRLLARLGYLMEEEAWVFRF